MFLQRRADEMRADATKAEKCLRRLLKAGWREQVPLCGNYIADFYHDGYRAVVEADGGYHNSQEQRCKDANRDAEMAAAGYLVMRFTNLQILKQTTWVTESIGRQLATLCRARGLPLPELSTSASFLRAAELRRRNRNKRRNGGKQGFHVIPERDPIDSL